jgi:hypothetical protein
MPKQRVIARVHSQQEFDVRSYVDAPPIGAAAEVLGGCRIQLDPVNPAIDSRNLYVSPSPAKPFGQVILRSSHGVILLHCTEEDAGILVSSVIKSTLDKCLGVCNLLRLTFTTSKLRLHAGRERQITISVTMPRRSISYSMLSIGGRE